MTDAGYGVYVRIQNANGELFSSSREELAQCLDDLEALGGAEFKAAIVKSLTNGKVAVESNVVALPQPVAVNESEALATAEAILAPAAPAAAVAEEQQQFERCDHPGCGGIKDQWRQGGISKNGKKYPGFWGCNNFRNHA